MPKKAYTASLLTITADYERRTLNAAKEIIQQRLGAKYREKAANINPLYMGDYDGMTSDFINTNAGFSGAIQVITNRGDPNVKAIKLP